MANWAKLQEDLTGLPVAKRAKYGIHFQKGDQIEAHLVGKPCHFQENGIWKQIDTALLATADGWYSSPHSDVIIHPDGRVRVKNSDYQQFTKLPSAKAGKLAGDKIIREFPGGEQHLIMKEGGFREEIHVFKPTFPLEKFIAKTTGNLPSKYKAHPITAEDAEGNSYEFMGDVAAFGAWLDKAVYPVVIDPDISITTGAGADTYIANHTNGVVPNWNFGAATTVITSNNATYTKKSLFRFDISSISAVAVATAAALKLYSSGTTNAQTFSVYKISDANGDWIEGTATGATQTGSPCWNYKAYHASTPTAWAGSAGLSAAGTDFINTVLATKTLSSGIGDTDLLEIPFGVDGLAVLQDWFGDATNNGLLMWSSAADENFHSGEATTESYRPVLSITYTASGIAIPVAQYYYNRLRRN